MTMTRAVATTMRTEAPGGKSSPEELLAAAHASCLAMALWRSRVRRRAARAARSEREVTFDKIGDNWAVTSSELEVKDDVLAPTRRSSLRPRKVRRRTARSLARSGGTSSFR